MLSTDSSIIRSGSDAARRMAFYGQGLESLHIIVLTGRQFDTDHARIELSRNVFAYPTNSSWKFMFARDTRRIAARIAAAAQGIPDRSWLVTAQDPFFAAVGKRLAKIFKAPLEIQIHTDFLAPEYRRESLKSYFRYRSYLKAIVRADVIRAVSERIRKKIVSVFPDAERKMYVLPISVDVQGIDEAKPETDLHMRYPQFDFLFLMASRVTREKNIGMAIDALAAVAATYPKTGLVIIGDGPEKHALRKRAHAAGISDNVIFEEGVPFESLISYLKTADAFLLASDYEGYGRTIVEAAAAKLPVIMTDVGVAGELIMNGITGAVVPVGDEHAFTDAMRSALADYPRFEKYAHAAFGVLSTYALSPEASVKRMHEAWRQAIEMR